MKLATPSLALNPIFVKELRGRMRGPRAFVFLTGVLGLLGLVSYGLFQLSVPRYYGGYNQPNAAAGAAIGQSVFIGLVFVTLLLICAIAPSLTAGAISGEHQRKTYDLLMATPLSSYAILFGKLGAALSYIVLILLAAVPITSLAYVFGGVTVTDLLKAFFVMAGFAVVYGVLGLFFSALFKRTGLAVGASYFLLGLATLGTFFVYVVVGVMNGAQPSNWLLALNPFSAMASALVDGTVTGPNGFYNGGSGVTPMLWGLSGGRFDANAPAQIPLWQYTVVVYTWLTVLFFALATQLIQPARRFRFGFWMWLIIGLLVVAVLVGAVAILAPGTFSPLRSALRWMMNSDQDVVVNGNFTAPLGTGWQTIIPQDLPKTQPPPIAIVQADGNTVLQVADASTDEGRVEAVIQKLDLNLPDAGIVRVRMRIRLSKHDTPVCGQKGAHCPLTLELRYTDQGGTQHLWTQGFYTSGQINRKIGITPRCLPCASDSFHIRVPQDQWYTYNTGDLFQENTRQDAPQALNELTLRSSGTAYQVQIQQVQVVVRKGRPLFYGGRPLNIGWSPQSLIPSFLWNLFQSTPTRPRSGFPPGGLIGSKPIIVSPGYRPPIPTSQPQPPVFHPTVAPGP